MKQYFVSPFLLLLEAAQFIYTQTSHYTFLSHQHFIFHLQKIYFNAHTCEAMCKILQLIYTIQYAPASPHKIIQNDFFRSLKIKMLDIYCNMWQWQKKGGRRKIFFVAYFIIWMACVLKVSDLFDYYASTL